MDFFSHVVHALIEIRHLAARWHIEDSRAALTDRSQLQPTISRCTQKTFLDFAISGILDIRQIYKCLLWEASRIDIDRGNCETPNEYAGRLGNKLPESRETLDEITGMYIETRYGEQEFSEGTVEYANFKWKNLRDLLRGPEDRKAA